ncbi:MAG: hypothetical protein N2235_03120 [Fischerella sp.]|nr:hypothetical protein [Fischerella sp.]
MDTLFWNKLNPYIKIKPAKKIFRNGLMYKLVLCQIEGCRAIKSNLGVKNYVELFDCPMLAEKIKNLEILKNLSTIYSYRIEGNTIAFFTKTEEELKEIVKVIPKNYREHIREIEGPINQTHAEKLKNNIIFNMKNKNFKYKVSLHDGLYEVSDLISIVNYLKNSGAEIPKWHQNLTNDRSFSKAYLYGKYFYTDDTSIFPFIELIRPRTINKIFRLDSIESLNKV